WFGGPGLKGTEAMMSMLGLEGQPWGTLAGLSEFGGGALTALGLLHPLGPIATLGSMGIAAGKVHRGKPIWATEGGAELSVLYMAAAVALSLDDPGRFSLDRLFGIRVPKAISLLAMAGVIASAVFVIQKEPAQAAPSDQQKPADAGQA
ncbi:MAG TPA: DoxX family protein, partial [Ktedonobacteraceae bacterium]